MKHEDKKVVARIYGVKYTYLESWIEHIAFVRNICAHYGRLYNVNLSKTPVRPPSRNGHKKASKNEMNRSISLIY